MTGIDHQPLEIRLLYHRFQHFFPDALVSPATETPLDSIPLTIFRRQVSPWCSRSQNPEHAIQKLTGILCVPSPRSLVSYCVRLENFPHRIGHIVPSIAVLHEETPLCVFLHYTTKRHFCRQRLTSPEDDDWKMLRLTPYPMMTPSFDVCLNVAVVNPLSRHYEEAVSFLECILQDMEPEAAMLLWPSRAQPVENPDYAQEWEYCHQEVLRLQAALETGEGSPQQKQALTDALEDAQAAMELVEASRWRISERTVSSYLAAVPALVVQKDSILNLVYDAGGLAIEQRYGAQQATMEELLLAFAHLSESITKEE